MDARWTKRDEDSARLPEGVKRIGYDADTSEYTFLDRKGTLYKSEPGTRYGRLEPVIDPTEKVSRERPEAFEDHTRVPRHDGDYAPKTFQDFLPPSMITSPTYSPDDPQPSKSSGHRRSGSSTSKKHVEFGPTPSSRDRLVSAVRTNALPKMQGVVQNLRRSVSSATKRNKDGSRERSKSEKRRSAYAELGGSDDGFDSKGHSRSNSANATKAETAYSEGIRETKDVL